MLLVSGRLSFAAAMTMSCETRSTTGNDRAWLSSPSYDCGIVHVELGANLSGELAGAFGVDGPFK
jgi:hypothetical protein